VSKKNKVTPAPYTSARPSIGSPFTCSGDRKAGVLPLRSLQKLGKRSPVHVVHHEENLVVRHQHVDGRHDVRVPHTQRELRLLDERGRERNVAPEPWVQALDGHQASEPKLVHEAAETHDRHAARGDLIVQLVLPDAANVHAAVGNPTLPTVKGKPPEAAENRW
jgi:hypothetical protein